MAGKQGAKGQKIGRNKRAPTNSRQAARTAANKERRIKLAEKLRAFFRERVLKVLRGTARAKRRGNPTPSLA